MSGVSRAFSREGPVDAEAVAAALRPTFTVTAGGGADGLAYLAGHL